MFIPDVAENCLFGSGTPVYRVPLTIDQLYYLIGHPIVQSTVYLLPEFPAHVFDGVMFC